MEGGGERGLQRTVRRREVGRGVNRKKEGLGQLWPVLVLVVLVLLVVLMLLQVRHLTLCIPW